MTRQIFALALALTMVTGGSGDALAAVNSTTNELTSSVAITANTDLPAPPPDEAEDITQIFPGTETPAAEVAEEPGTTVYVDEQPVADNRVTLYDGVAYVSLNFVTSALRSDAVVAWETDRMVARGTDFVLSAKVGDPYISMNGRYFYVSGNVKTHESGDTLVPARVLAQALGATVSWDGDVHLTSGGTLPESGETYYDPQSVDLLARIIYHESGNQPFKGQLAVGNVILNRVASPIFPNTISDVIYQKNQFTGATAYAPDAESILAAKLCLDGAVVLDNAYWFNRAGVSCWASKNKTLVARIGNHDFYG